ncbi:type I secretion protein TolC [Thalassobaculum fulvum]|uniref:Type I secretion protein TolC n=1 Tax=Thalassobaculum fulvum TaxID=1633335 RepID=A0A918XRN9_9PROT|nr:TolC family outer membrane protein [Thalassobaculum fulvum]GHD48337.1 type I secretion protein TolC [Thalassobaculum fulvum]
MPMKRRSIVLAGLLAGWLSGTGLVPAEAMTLEEALALTYETNPGLLAARAQLRAVDENVSQARASWRPNVSSSLSLGVTDQNTKTRGVTTTDDSSFPRTGNLSVSQALYSGGAFGAAIAGAEADVQAQRANLFNSEQETLLQAVTAYVNVLREQATLELQVNNLTRLQKQLEATRDRFRVGEVTRTDVAQAEARVSRARSDRTQAEGNLITARVAFERIVGQVPGSVETPGTPAGLPTGRDEAVDIAVRENFTLVEAKFTELSARHAVEEAEAGLMPTLDLIGQAQKTYDTSGGDNETTSLSAELQLTIPIYQQGTEYSSIRQTKETANRARLLVDNTRRAVVDSAASAFEAYQTALARIESLKAEVKSSEIALEGVQQEATVGARTVLDVLDAEQELLDGQVNLVQAQRDATVASYQLLQALGRLTAQDLNLPVQVYDYDSHYVDVSGKLWGTEPPGRMPGN